MEKNIVENFFWTGGDLYTMFLIVLESIAGQRLGVRQALDHIKKYKGDRFTQPDEKKQWQWLQKLLPDLK